MPSHEQDDSYVRRAVLIMLTVALLASVFGTLIPWFSPAPHLMDMIIPPAGVVIFAGLMVVLLRSPRRVLDVAYVTLLVATFVLTAPAWFYTLHASMTPGEQLIAVYPPVSAIFVVLIVVMMIFIPGRRAVFLTVLAWLLIALPVLVYLFAHPHEMFTPRGAGLVMTYGPVAMMVGVLMPIQRGLKGTIQRMSDERTEMEAMLHRDALTGVHNRRLGQHVLQGCINSKTPTGVIMLDLDRFKAINDNHGHPVGDEVLKAVAQHCKSLLREGEWFSRWGGEEFLVILPDSDAHGLVLIAERLLAGVSQMSVGPIRGLTASFGATMLRETDSLETVLRRADKALYSAKAQGGNRLVVEPAGEAGTA